MWNVRDTAGTPRTRALAAALRQARVAGGFGVRELARKLDVSHTTISQWETGKRIPTTEDVSAFLTTTNTTGKRRKEVIELARNAADPDWLAIGMPLGMAGILECERTAAEILNWSPMVIPGAFQTAAYAEAIFSVDEKLLPKEIESRVQSRLDRRKMLTKARGGLPPAEYTALIGEWGLRQQIGGSAVHIEQLRALMEFAELPTVTIRVVPIGSGWHPGIAGPFVMYQFSAAPPIVHLEHHRSSAFLYDDKNGYITDYKIAANQVRRASLSPEDSASHINKIIEELEE